MDAIAIVVAVALGAAAVFMWLSRNKLGQELVEARQAVAAARSEAAAARKEAERRSEDKKGRGEELSQSREKLRDARKRLHDSQEEARRARELANARAEEMRQLDLQISAMREDAASMTEQLRRLQEEAERPKGRRREEPAPIQAPAAPVVVAPAAPLEPAVVDERLEQMGREVESHKARAQAAERRAADAERKAAESRIQADEARDEVRKARGRAEANNRVYLVTKGEADVWKARYGTLEQKWNELWRELEGIGWKGRTTKDLAPMARPAGGGRPLRKGAKGRQDRNGVAVPAGTNQAAPRGGEESREMDGIVTAASMVEDVPPQVGEGRSGEVEGDASAETERPVDDRPVTTTAEGEAVASTSVDEATDRS